MKLCKVFIILNFFTILNLGVFSGHYKFVTIEFFPLEYTDSMGKVKGIAVEIVENIMRNLGHTIEIEVYPWTRSLLLVKLGKADAIFTAYQNPEREMYLDYSKEVLIWQIIYFYKLRSKKIGFSGNLTDLKDYRIGVVSTISYGQIFDELRKELMIDTAPSLEVSLNQLLIGRVDIIPSNTYVGDNTVMKLGLENEVKKLSVPLEKVPSFIAFSKIKKLTNLRDQFDIEFKRFKKSKEYQHILDKYGIQLID
ncbi:MAG: transporter substrate-binding domain-containing protein [Spirochaetes bacterium]|nr:transporter substrate-binding domain-containing protein [Spirochaetota bacterium]